MSCERVSEQLAEFLTGALDAPDEDAIARHLDACAACGRRLARLASLEEALRPVPGPAPEGVLAEFGRFLVEEKRWWLIPALVVLGALLSVIVFAEGSAIAPFIYSIF